MLNPPPVCLTKLSSPLELTFLALGRVPRAAEAKSNLREGFSELACFISISKFIDGYTSTCCYLVFSAIVPVVYPPSLLKDLAFLIAPLSVVLG